MAPPLIIAEDLLAIADTSSVEAYKLDVHFLHNMINIPSISSDRQINTSGAQ